MKINTEERLIPPISYPDLHSYFVQVLLKCPIKCLNNVNICSNINYLLYEEKV